MNLYTASITILLVMNPLGNMPLFISALQNIPAKRQLHIILREALFALLILTIFLFAGKPILKGLMVTPAALGIAGGIVLMIIAIRLIFPQPKEKEEDLGSEPFLVPLAIPLFAGPACIATVMLVANQEGNSVSYTFIALVIAWSLSTCFLLASAPISKFLGKKGLIAIERLMGMLLTTIAVQMLLSGLKLYFRH